MSDTSTTALTLGPVGDLAVDALVRLRPLCLNANMSTPCEEDWDGDEAVTRGAPEVLDDEVFRPLVRDADLQERSARGAMSPDCNRARAL